VVWGLKGEVTFQGCSHIKKQRVKERSWDKGGSQQNYMKLKRGDTWDLGGFSVWREDIECMSKKGKKEGKPMENLDKGRKEKGGEQGGGGGLSNKQKKSNTCQQWGEKVKKGQGR